MELALSQGARERQVKKQQQYRYFTLRLSRWSHFVSGQQKLVWVLVYCGDTHTHIPERERKRERNRERERVQ